MMSFKKSAVIALSLLVVTAQVNAAAAVPAAPAAPEAPAGLSAVGAAPVRQPAALAALAALEAELEAAGVRRPAALEAAGASTGNPGGAGLAVGEGDPAGDAGSTGLHGRRLPAIVAPANNKNIAQRAWNGAAAAFCVAVAGVQNHKVTTGASVATVVAVGATYARLNVMFKAASPAVKAAGFKAFAKAELKKAFSRDAKADKYVTAGVVATLISAAATVGSVTLHETGLGAKGCSSVVRGWNALPKRPAAPALVA